MMEPVAPSVVEPQQPATPAENGNPVPEVAPAESVETEKPEGHGSVWNWIKSASNNQFVQKVMERTKTGVDRMITTLDPGMTPFIRDGGDICVVVASDKEVKWGPIRDAFQKTFGAATIMGIAAQPKIAPQPVGYSAGLKGAQERIAFLRKSGAVDKNQVCVAVENFIVEQLTDRWFDVGCLLLQDPENEITLELFTMAVPVENDVVTEAQAATSSTYDLRWSGLAVTVGETIQKKLPWVNPSDWHRALTGTSRRDIIYSTAICLAELYKRRLPEKSIEQDV
uniref:Protein PRRC1-like n=1 Tax=Phallusia mammillata TaxID=59560 RepID=A0A6F9DPZ0_9ASCI|nr:protein PRRC1-like [Phallusia mammillata]